MRNRITYILIAAVLCLFASCVEKQIYEPDQPEQQNGTVIFSATPKGFTTANVGTKAEGEEDDGRFKPEVFENTIYNAFFLLFDHNGLLRVKGIATVNEDNQTVTYNIGRDVLSIFPTFTICFLANVPESTYNNDFTVGTTTWTALQSHYLSIAYAPFSETGSVGVPQKADLNGDGTEEYALPMFGSKEVTRPYSDSKDYSFQLERMFARVEVMVSLGIQDDGSIATSTPQFSMVECDFHNIPTLVPLMRQTSSTACSDVPDSEVDTRLDKEEGITAYNLSTEDSKILYYSPSDEPVYRSLYCYVPEHKLGNCGPNSVHGNKPTLITGTTKRPAYISISGFIVDRVGTSYDAKYNIYFGENATDNFDLSRNTIYKNYVRINGVNSADHRVEKMEEVKEVINDVTRKGMAANCYVISAEGTYLLPAYRGAYNNLTNAPMCELGTNVVIACDNPAISITFDENLSKQSTIVFNVDNTGNDLLSGNAVIGRYKENGELDWSWHLWFIPGAEFGEGSNDLGETNRIGGLLNANMYDGTVMADRNLGVLASLTSVDSWLPPTMVGLYYRYGHRNPYFADQKYGNGSDYHGYDQDNYAAWNTAGKSVTDPCPPGYRIPPVSVWQGTNAQNSTNEHYSGMLGIQVSAFNYWDHGTGGILVTDDIMYPYGHMTPSGVVSSGTEDMRFTLKTELSETSGRNEGTPSPSNPGFLQYQYRTVTYTETAYTDLNYIVPSVACNVGSVLTKSTNESVNFKSSTGNVQKTYITNNSVFVSCKKTVTQVSATERRRRNLLSYGSWEEYGTPTVTVIYNEVITDRNSITADWKTSAANELIGSWGSSAQIGTTMTGAFNPAYGYQVRCIQE